jgi:hypothetical protein
MSGGRHAPAGDGRRRGDHPAGAARRRGGSEQREVGEAPVLRRDLLDLARLDDGARAHAGGAPRLRRRVGDHHGRQLGGRRLEREVHGGAVAEAQHESALPRRAVAEEARRDGVRPADGKLRDGVASGGVRGAHLLQPGGLVAHGDGDASGGLVAGARDAGDDGVGALRRGRGAAERDDDGDAGREGGRATCEE